MRYEFTKTQMRDMRARSGDVCEAGKFDTHAMYGMADADTCSRTATEFDHITATALKQEPIRSIDEGLHVCAIHHRIKTHGHDRPKIGKAKRLNERNAGIKTRKGRPLPGTKASGIRKHMNGDVSSW